MKQTTRKVISLLLTILFITSSFTFSFTVNAAETVVYVSSTGKDGFAGTAAKPYNTLKKAFQKVYKNGGTIVLMDHIGKNSTANSVWTEDVIGTYLHPDAEVTITGKDPYTGEIYEDAGLQMLAAKLHGPVKIEYLALYPTTQYATLSTLGYAFTVGEGVTNKGTSFTFYDGISDVSSRNRENTISSVNTRIDSGTFYEYYIGGGYSRLDSSGNIYQGIYGDCNVEINGGSFENLNVGFYKYNSQNGLLKGNVTITVNGGTFDNTVTLVNTEGGIQGCFQAIINNDTYFPCSVEGNNGTYIIYSGINGKVEPTDTPGIVNIKPDKGYKAYLNNLPINEGIRQLNVGNSFIEYLKEDAKDAIVTNKGYTDGFPDGTFRPDQKLTRAQACKMVANIFDDDSTVIEEGEELTFSDISKRDWYYKYAAYFKSIGALEYLADEFCGNEYITRGEFVNLLYCINLADKKTVKLSDIDEISADDLFYPAAQYAVGARLISGYSDGEYKLGNELTRAEAVTILNRFLDRIPTGKNVNVSFSDVEGNWAEYQIFASAGIKNIEWQYNAESADEYIISGTDAQGYITSLYEQKDNISGAAVKAGAEEIRDKMQNDIVNSADGNLNITGTTYYVSSINGKDWYSGKSADRPWKSLDKIKNTTFNTGDAILFERGSVFRGSLYGADLTDITYGAYGTGAKPVFMGSLANYAGASYWNSTGVQNVYVCTAALDNVGLIVFDNDINSYNSNALYGIKRSKNSSGFSGYSDLKNDLEFYSDLDNKKLYLYSASGNPGSRFSDIEICEKRNIFVGKADNLRIDNLSMMYTGSHAIGLNNSTNVKVTNCIISWIGGSVLSVDSVTGIETRYGNAIEIYNSCDGFYVDNCWLYQIYDTGITYQQWSGDSACIHKDISFTKNLIEKTHWGIEFINIGQTNGTNVHKVENAYNAYNYIKDTGKGFGSVTENRTGMSAAFAGQFVGICNDNDIAAEYNIFDTSVGYLTQIPKNMNVEKYNNNIYIQYNGGGFGWIKGVNIPSDENTKSELVRLVNENGAVVVLTPDM